MPTWILAAAALLVACSSSTTSQSNLVPADAAVPDAAPGEVEDAGRATPPSDIDAPATPLPDAGPRMSVEQTGSTTPLNHVTGSGVGDILAVGAYGFSAHSTGDGAWTGHGEKSASYDLVSVWSAGPDEAYAGTAVCGNGGCGPSWILHTADGGATWTQVSLESGPVASIWGASTADIWFVGGQSVGHTTDRFATTQLVPIALPMFTAPQQVVGSRDGQLIIVLVSDGEILFSRDAGATWSGPALGGLTGAVKAAWDGTALWIAGYGGAVRSTDLATATPVTALGSPVNAVWAAGPGDVWFCARDGIVRTTDGDASLEIIDPQGTCLDIWGPSANDVFFVGLDVHHFR